MTPHVELLVTPLPIAYTATRSRRRRTLEIQVNAEGLVRVLAPWSATERDIERLVHKKTRWILATFNKLTARNSGSLPVELCRRKTLPYLGVDYPLHVFPGGGDQIRLRFDGGFHVDMPWHLEESTRSFHLRRLLESWYKEQARGFLADRVKFYCTQYRLPVPTKLQIRDQRTRWGSCSKTGSVSLNWRLILAPESVIDYVVVHELCHRIEPNHSKQFWREVGRVIPEYEVQRQWLKEHGGGLVL